MKANKTLATATKTVPVTHTYVGCDTVYADLRHGDRVRVRRWIGETAMVVSRDNPRHAYAVTARFLRAI